MTVIGRGDLSPPRRHRHRGRRGLVAVLVVASLVLAGWISWRAWNDRGSTPAAAPPAPCPLPTALPPLPPTGPFDVLNGTLRPHLAHAVATGLRRSWHLRVRRVGNTARLVRGNSQVRYPSALAFEARVVAAHVVPTATLVASPAARVIELDLGPTYVRLADAFEVRQARLRLAVGTASASPAPTPCAGHS